MISRLAKAVASFGLALAAAACTSAPPPAIAPAAPQNTEQKMAWILRLEDQRILRDPPPAVPPAPAQSPVKGKAVALALPPPSPDLIRLLSDPDARIRRRAALAVGHVGSGDGVAPLQALLADNEPEVRQMAAFALGLIGDGRAKDRLVAALGDGSPLVEASAAEALGLLGDASAAPAIAAMADRVAKTGAVGGPLGPEDDVRRDTPAAAYRLALFALARLKAYDALATAALDGSGQPRAKWWPVAYALQRVEDPRAAPALRALVGASEPYTRAFAVKGLGALKDPAVVPVLLPLVTSADRPVAVEAIRALGRIGDPRAAPPLLKLVQGTKPDALMRLEAIRALGGLRAPGVIDDILDAVADPDPLVRASALPAAASIDPEGFVPVLAGLDPDPIWSVRAALATTLGTLTTDIALPRLTLMLDDKDQRVIPAVLSALVKLHAPGAEAIALARLKADDPVVRAAAAACVGQLKPASGVEALTEAYRSGQRDTTYLARAAALAALAQYGAAEATPVLKEAFADKDWAVRVRAAALMKQLDPATDAASAIRPAPTDRPADGYRAPSLVAPPVSMQVYLDTDRGTIQIELAMLDAPLTVENFITLARKGYFNGLNIHRVVADFVIQSGDPRGDGEGGPGYTIRDELNERPYVRGTVGMALDWADTGGSQFFITHSPQPHLDAKYTVFGRVTAGMDVVDQIRQGDVIRRVRIWDGDSMTDVTR